MSRPWWRALDRRDRHDRSDDSGAQLRPQPAQRPSHRRRPGAPRDPQSQHRSTRRSPEPDRVRRPQEARQVRDHRRRSAARCRPRPHRCVDPARRLCNPGVRDERHQRSGRDQSCRELRTRRDEPGRRVRRVPPLHRGRRLDRRRHRQALRSDDAVRRGADPTRRSRRRRVRGTAQRRDRPRGRAGVRHDDRHRPPGARLRAVEGQLQRHYRDRGAPDDDRPDGDRSSQPGEARRP